MKSKFLIGLGFYVVALSIYADPATPYQPHVVYYPVYDNNVLEKNTSQTTSENIGDDVSLDDFFAAMQKLSENQTVNTSSNEPQKGGLSSLHNTSTAITVSNPITQNTTTNNVVSTTQFNNVQPVNNMSSNSQADVLVVIPNTVTVNNPVMQNTSTSNMIPTVQINNATLPVVNNNPVVKTNPTDNVTIPQPVDIKEKFPNIKVIQNNTAEYVPIPVVNTQVQISSHTGITVPNINTPQAKNQDIQPIINNKDIKQLNLATPVEYRELENDTLDE